MVHVFVRLFLHLKTICAPGSQSPVLFSCWEVEALPMREGCEPSCACCPDSARATRPRHLWLEPLRSSMLCVGTELVLFLQTGVLVAALLWHAGAAHHVRWARLSLPSFLALSVQSSTFNSSLLFTLFPRNEVRASLALFQDAEWEGCG